MNHLRTIRTLAALLVVTMIAGVAFAQTTSVTSDADATVTAVNNLALDTGAAVALAPAVGTDVSDSTTTLSFETNDGTTFKITASASAWTFAPTVATTSANTYPVLTAVASANAGTNAPGGQLISATNTLTVQDLVTGITSASGTATVTLGASVTQTVVAGVYSTTITYDFVNP